jgi:hypothetical protein
MRCRNCGANAPADAVVCDVCGATLPAMTSAPDSRGQNRPDLGPQRAPGTPRSQSRPGLQPQRAPGTPRGRDGDPQGTGKRPSTLGDLFGRSASAEPDTRDSSGRTGKARRSLPRFGPSERREGEGERWDTSSGKGWNLRGSGSHGAPEMESPDAPYASGRPDDFPRRGPRDRAASDSRTILKSLISRARQELRPGGLADATSWGARWAGRRSSPPMPSRSAQPDYDDEWHGRAPQPGSGWDMPYGPTSTPPEPLGRAWPDAAMNMPQVDDDYSLYTREREYRDTGRGWGVAMPNFTEGPAGSYQPMITEGPAYERQNLYGRAATMVIGRMGRFAFNAMLLGLILAILIIPSLFGIKWFQEQRHVDSPRVTSTHSAPIPTPYPGYQNFQSSTFTMAYPSGWTVTKSTTTIDPYGTAQQVNFTGPANTHAILAVEVLPSVPGDQMETTLSHPTHVFNQGTVANIQTVIPEQPGPPISGRPSLLEGFTFDLITSQQAIPMRAIAESATLGVLTYVVVIAAPGSQFDALFTQYFTPMLKAFYVPCAQTQATGCPSK